MIWGREYNSTSQTISIQAREFESYLEKIFIDTRYMGIGSPAPDVARFVDIDLFQGVQLLMNVANTIGDVPITVNGGTSGVNVSPTYSRKDYKNVYQGILDLSQGANGFDFNVDVYYDGTGTPQRVMNLGYPRIGYVYSSADVNAPTLQMPGNILDYSYFEDGTLMATTVYVNGGGTVASVAIAAPPGYPTYELALSYSDITNVNLLTGIADGRLAAVINPPTTLKITQVASQEPTVGRVAPGDDVRVSIRDARFPTGLNAVYRVASLTVTPNESGGPEQITYALTQPNNIYS
jgi:hypothetical protein